MRHQNIIMNYGVLDILSAPQTLSTIFYLCQVIKPGRTKPANLTRPICAHAAGLGSQGKPGLTRQAWAHKTSLGSQGKPGLTKQSCARKAAWAHRASLGLQSRLKACLNPLAWAHKSCLAHNERFTRLACARMARMGETQTPTEQTPIGPA